jgi:hypothetical protein
MTTCSYFSCGKDAITREAWYDNRDEIPSFATGEVHWCMKHYKRFGGNNE